MSITSGSALIQAGLLYSPLIVLECLGVVVVHVWLRDTWGAWSPTHRKVVVASGLSPVQERCVLAHELEHVLADDTGCGVGELAARREARADLEAARKLIGISDLAQVAQQADDIHAAAHQLHVTERMLRIRLDDLEGEGWPWPGTSKTAG